MGIGFPTIPEMKSRVRLLARRLQLIVEVSRKEAIFRAIQLAQEGDIVIIAGKGHEKEQKFAHKTIPFDDIEVAKEALAAL